MSIHYIFILLIVLIIVIIQIIAIIKNLSIINELKSLFPCPESLSLDENNGKISLNENNGKKDYANHKNFEDTLDDINNYLNENKNRPVDYQIIKEIVERDSQRMEEEVDTMLSTPLYLGLMATILGAAIGVVSFAWADLKNLLTNANIETEGIKTLLTDIGIAMIASFLGVLFTAISTYRYKDARGVMLKMKNKFLSWIQTKVMPNISDNLTGALTKMTNDLNNFNSTFAENTKELKNTLSQVTDNYNNQVKLLDAIDKIKIVKIAQANIEVYDKLQGCTQELERLFKYLGNSEEYIAQVVKLNSQLGDIEERTRLSEDLGNYFKNEIEYIQDRQGLMRQQMSGLDSVVGDALENLSGSITQNISTLTIHLQKQNQQVENVIEEQQKCLSKALDDQRTAINNKIAEMQEPFGGLTDIFSKAQKQISSTFENQNSAIKEMLAIQKELLEKEISSQRDMLKQQFVNMPEQITELTKVMKLLNQTMQEQQQKIESQEDAIQVLISSTGNSLHPQEETKKKWMNIAIIISLGSFIVLLVILISMLCASACH